MDTLASLNKKVYVKLVSLDFNERPRETIEGRATAGSVNIDGASAVRRTCSLTLVSDIQDITNYYWTLKTKFKVEVGVFSEQEQKIVWFKQGTYVITSFSASYSGSQCTISISGKDKMCMLNGELGGVINSSLVLDTYDEVVGSITKKIKLPIKNIIRDLMYQYGNEPYHNIIINDLDLTGLELQEYRYDTPLYLLRKKGEDQYFNATLVPKGTDYDLSSLSQYDSLSTFITTTESEVVNIEGQDYQVAKIEYGQTAGYKEIDLVYPDELSVKAGENVVTVLDKLVKMLGNYEFFYDIDGRFIFQEKNTYINTAWNSTAQNEGDAVYVTPFHQASPYVYEFKDLRFFTSVSNTPNLSNLKNDYTVWGERPNGTPIHMRYAIDKKPIYYKSIQVSQEELKDYNDKYGLSVEGQESIAYWWRDNPGENGKECADWREIIYQMQKDYYKYGHLDDFNLKIIEANPQYYPLGLTGYEQYYIDIQGFWRYLYDPESDNTEQYYQEGQFKGWNKMVYESPSDLVFWFDFLDAQESVLGEYSVANIGTRPKVVNDNAVKSIYYGDTPSIIFTDKINSDTYKDGYRYFTAGSQYKDIFKKSAQGKSAKDAIDNLLYNYSYCIESITINSIPIYNLEPNTLIYIQDSNTKIKGDYIITRMSIPLTYSGTMTINGTKLEQRLY